MIVDEFIGMINIIIEVVSLFIDKTSAKVQSSQLILQRRTVIKGINLKTNLDK